MDTLPGHRTTAVRKSTKSTGLSGRTHTPTTCGGPVDFGCRVHPRRPVDARLGRRSQAVDFVGSGPVGSGVIIGSGARIGHDTVIGDGVVIERGAFLESRVRLKTGADEPQTRIREHAEMGI